MRKSYKILFIFLLSIILSILIYSRFDNKKISILSIGDNLSLGKTPFNTYSKSYNDYIRINNKIEINDWIASKKLSYEEIYKMIYYDTNVYNKGKYINIKNVIKEHNIIIISANNDKTFQKCNRNNRILIEYLDSTFNTITKIIDLIDFVTETKIIIISPYCGKYTKEIDEFINNYYIYKGVHFINVHNILHSKTYYLPNIHNPYPSLEGYNAIYNEINKVYKYNNLK